MPASAGSGVIIDGANGIIVTNGHVVRGSGKIKVTLLGGDEKVGTVLGTDEDTDLAVVQIESETPLSTATLGDSSSLKIGQLAVAVGNPYGLNDTLTFGIISGLNRENVNLSRYEDFIQTDASINPGNSGGPLISLDGNIIGINTGVAAIGSGVGFAIPVENALKIANQLVESGSVDRGWMGVGIQNLTPELAQTLEFRNGDGVLVNSVDSKTPAHIGGIRRGDIILQFDGKPVPDSKLLQKMVADTKIGRDVLVKVFREGQEKALKVKIGKLVS